MLVATVGAEGKATFSRSEYNCSLLFHPQVVKYLVKKGADLSSKKDNGRTPLDEAKSLYNVAPKVKEVVDFLTEHQVSKKSSLVP